MFNADDRKRLARMDAAVAALGTKLDRLLAKETQAMATLDDLVTKVQNVTTLDGSIATLITGVAKEVSDLQAQLAAAGSDPTKIQAVSDGLDALSSALTTQQAALQAALPANTPAAP